MKGRNENKEKEYLSYTMAPPFNFKFLISNVIKKGFEY